MTALKQDVHATITAQYEAEPSAKDTRPLRFITCGSVDDGKSTLIGRLLWDTKMVFDDQAAALETQSGGTNEGLDLPDFANLLDGLQAEREQGITIDVAYRYFSTPRRAFIVADTPGHEQYTRNMATGASTADLAVLLVDARAGILEQTRRHATIVSLMGISQVVVAINKIDLVDYDQKRFETLEAEFHEIARRLGIASVTAIPTSAVKGENVAFAAQQTMQWYQGPTLLQTLERATKRSGQSVGFRMPVQRVCRPDESFRGYQGTIAGGAVKPGDSVMILPSGETANVSRIVTFDLVRNAGVAGDAVTLVLDRQVDVSRGDMIASIEARPHVGHAFDANLIVLDAAGLRNEGRYWLKSGSRRQSVTVHGKAVLDLQTGDWDNDTELSVNRIASVQLQFVEPAVFDAYDANRETGSFILIDLDTNNTVAGGMIVAPSSNVTSLEPKGAQSVDTLAHEHSGMTAVILPTSLAEKLQESGLIDSEHAKFAALNHSQLAALRDGSEGKNG